MSWRSKTVENVVGFPQGFRDGCHQDRTDARVVSHVFLHARSRSRLSAVPRRRLRLKWARKRPCSSLAFCGANPRYCVA